MLSFFKRKTSSKVEVPSLSVDVHSHLIPGIDDGAQSIEESIALLRKLQDLGYKKVITTPHIMCDAYGNTRSSILKGLEDLQIVANSHGIDMRIEAASEYYLDEGFLPLIKGKELLLIADKYLLFETSYTHRPAALEETIFEILTAGHIPLLAHPERYRYIKEPEKEYATLKDLGVEFQVNINSFGGHYGKEAKKNALFLSQHGMIDFLGSDTHNMKHVENLSFVFDSKEYKDIYRLNTIKNKTLYVNIINETV